MIFNADWTHPYTTGTNWVQYELNSNIAAADDDDDDDADAVDNDNLFNKMADNLPMTASNDLLQWNIPYFIFFNVLLWVWLKINRIVYTSQQLQW